MNPDELRAVRRTLIGDVPDDVVIIATPIRSLFELVKNHGLAEVAHGGWWPRLVLGRVHAVLIPQGGAVADLCAALTPEARFALLGYAGSLTSSVGVGDLVRPASAVFPDGRGYGLTGTDAGGVQHAVVTVSNLLATYASATTLSCVATVADMECAHAAAALKRSGAHPLAAYLLVTDRWPDSPFYEQPSNAPNLAKGRRAVAAELMADLQSELDPLPES